MKIPGGHSARTSIKKYVCWKAIRLLGGKRCIFAKIELTKVYSESGFVEPSRCRLLHATVFFFKKRDSGSTTVI